MSDSYTVTIGNSFLSDDWTVECTCGFEVTVGTREAAEDTARWHRGESSQLGDISGTPGQCPVALAAHGEGSG